MVDDILPSAKFPANEQTVLIYGNIMLHRKIFPKSFSAGAPITLIRCSEDLSGAFSVWRRFRPSLVVARQAFIEQLPTIDLLRLTAYGRRVPVLAMLENDSHEAARKMLQLGCRGVLPNHFKPKLLKQAILKILSGEIWADGNLLANLVSDLLITDVAKKSALTPREECIQEMILKGFGNSAIAEALFISRETVRWHTRRLYRKIGGSLRSYHPPTDQWDPAVIPAEAILSQTMGEQRSKITGGGLETTLAV